MRFTNLFHQVFLLVLVLASATTAEDITTVAGTSIFGFSGDGGPATDARLLSPTGVAVDAVGNLFIADASNLRIRKVDTSGIITTVAGNGLIGSSGDGGLAINARFSNPHGVAADAAGNFFIADFGAHRIRKVDTTSGIITTVAGNGTVGFDGDGGLATDARLALPHGVAVDVSGNLFIADRANQRIRKVDATSGIITTVAGDGTFGYSGDGVPATTTHLASPFGVAVDLEGNLFIVDLNNHRIRKVDATSGIITTVAGNGIGGFNGDGGPATAAKLNFPVGVAVDAAGNLFITDGINQRIRKVDTSGIITTVAGNGTFGFGGDGGPAIDASFANPRGIAVDSAGRLFIADLSNWRIRKVGSTAQELIEELIEDVQALGLPGMAGQAQLNAALNALSEQPPNIQTAIDALQAFINFVNAQSGKKIPVQDADDLINDAQVIIDLLQAS